MYNIKHELLQHNASTGKALSKAALVLSKIAMFVTQRNEYFIIQATQLSELTRKEQKIWRGARALASFGELRAVALFGTLSVI